MKRRTVISGLGAAAAGTALGVGTGAFTTVDAERQVSLNVVDDANAYVQLDSLDIDEFPNATYFEDSDSRGDGLIKLDVNSNTNGGEGIGLDSEYEILQIFELRNAGTEEVEFAFENDPDDDITDDERIDDLVYLDESGDDITTDSSLTLAAGDSENVGVRLETAPEEDVDDPDAPPANATTRVLADEEGEFESFDGGSGG